MEELKWRRRPISGRSLRLRRVGVYEIMRWEGVEWVREEGGKGLAVHSELVRLSHLQRRVRLQLQQQCHPHSIVND